MRRSASVRVPQVVGSLAAALRWSIGENGTLVGLPLRSSDFQSTHRGRPANSRSASVAVAAVGELEYTPTVVSPYSKYLPLHAVVSRVWGNLFIGHGWVVGQ